MIWSLMLGIMLTSVFFFFGTRLRESSLAQQSLIAYQTQRMYVESYADFLRLLPPADLALLTRADLPDADITGTLSQSAAALEGFLDTGETSPVYLLPDGIGDISIEWNRCDYGQTGDLLIAGSTTPKFHGAAGCAAGFDEITTITPTPTGATLSFSALSAPFHYRISAMNNLPLGDSEWHLSLSAPLPFGKRYLLEETFSTP